MSASERTGTAVLTEAQRRLVYALNPAPVDHQNEATVHALFAQQAARRPGAVAVVDARGALTYGELEARSNQLAHLLAARGVAVGDCVALCLERSVETVVAVLGILKAGAAYLPLEPSYPRERLGFMVQDAGAKVLLTQESLAPLMPAVSTCLLLEALPAALARESSAAPDCRGHRASQRAYVMYTSGSTGQPKGVQVPHRAINRLVCAVDYVDLGEAQVLLHAAPLAFDASTFELWGALLNGGRVVCHPERVPTAAGLRECIARHGVTTAWLTAALFNALVDEDASCLRGLSQLLTGGEALSVTHVRRAQAALPGTQLINGYGPTECTTFAATYRIPRELPPTQRAVPIGRPIRDTRLYILDAERMPVALGEEGELYIAGAGLALGYLGRPELDAERFVPDPFSPEPGERMYRTGDVVRYLPDGNVDFVGRADRQVKVRGFRIELGEIEAALLAQPGLRSGAVVAREDVPGHKRLVAYLVAKDAAARPALPTLREALLARLPEYMVPSAFVWLQALPLTDNGKLDLRALPAPEQKRPELAQAYVQPRSRLEQLVARGFAELLQLDRVGALDNFFELGGTSLLAVRAAARLAQDAGAPVPAVQLFQCPTPAQLAAWLEGQAAGASIAADASRRAGIAGGGRLADVALVGMAGRFPGAPDVDALWKNLCAGVDATSLFTPGELDPLVPVSLREDPAYVRARGVLEGVELFDAAFFGIGPKEAELMDPQQRLFLEACWQGLERAGYSPDTAGLVGVFGGVYNNSYHQTHVSTRPDLVERVGAFQVMVSNEKDYVATRVAHRLNLRGPALSIHTACSTSLVAVCEAVKSLQLGECDVALAGGASLTVPVKSGYLYQEGGMLSADGRCKPFSEGSTGTTFSDGVGVVVLKRLQDALADGDHVHAVIRGAAVNNDGGNKASFTAPSASGQAAVVALAQARAGVSPRDIGYVEAHGTATPLGDPIEVQGLTQAFREGGAKELGYCALGSVKSNFGHLVIAAGVTGLIKAALSLEHECIPPTLHFERPNPKCELEKSPFFVASSLRPWPRTGARARFAGVSSFGVGGTNAHVVLQEPPAREPGSESRPRQVLLLSARTRTALDAASANLATFLRAHPEVPLADVAFTLQTGRTGFAHRRAVVCASGEDAARALESKDPVRVSSRELQAGEPRVAFLFPGQGSQYVDMGKALYAREPVFRDAVDRCAELLLPHLGKDLRTLMYPPAGDAEAAARALRETSITQPALFVTSYALAQLWLSLGVQPGAMVGHSVGEFVAACLAGVFSLEDALKLVALRGRLMEAQPRGSMLSVRLPAAQLEQRLSAWPTLCVASDNGPSLCVVAGPTPDVERLQRELEAEGAVCRALQTSHAFHSAMMEPAVQPFLQVVQSVALCAPRLPIVSTATGAWLTAEQATDPTYWARHLRVPVRFSGAVRTLLEQPEWVLLEVGPRNTLSTLARQQVKDRVRQVAVASLGETATEEAEYASLLGALGQLWLAGARLDWKAFYARERRYRVALPTYPFERQRFWVEPRAAVAAAPAPSLEASAPAAPALAAALARAPAPALQLVNDQLQLMQQQLQLLQNRKTSQGGNT
ncbi:amino acid adenylation domain-containing protein [Aggregicoccus sp. 17bor-14]|uniref:polyketide synthase n=1 Tax=Myxococcaceae TaxID=31 RepID=UPI00129CF657|nr:MULTISPECIES: polyketide synthase [Myxococcaceae]MBF5042081.1 amino acid adenylation domain-containing protein [Simulacricoccus sp. 17bor-14]MRI87859.1 amino acid adenylation domain-containing protein [Aggregicoccus sp. 17bor-14]